MNEEINNKDYRPLTPFKGWVLENFPFIEADFDAITNYELICKITEYLNNVIYNQNEVQELATELVDGYNALLNYVNNYFDNLDVQEEINNKLDEMAENGTLTNLIKDYVDPIYQQYETTINNQIANQNLEIQSFKNTTNSQIETINTKVDQATSGSPLVASSTAGMVDTTRVYVNTTDGYWYYYDGTQWTQGGIYQSTVENYDNTLTVNDAVANSKAIGDKVNPYFKKYNVLNASNVTANKMYDSSGNIVDAIGIYIFNDLITIKNGDTIHLNYLQSSTNIVENFLYHIVKVDAYGNYLSRLTPTTQSYYTFNEDCFIKLDVNVGDKTVGNFFAWINTIDNDEKLNNNTINTIEEKADNIENDIDGFTHQYNYFDPDKSFYNQSMDANGNIIYINNTFFISNPIKIKTGDVIYSGYFGSGTRPSLVQALTYDENMHFITRTLVNASSYTAVNNGYVRFNIAKGTTQDAETLGNAFTLSINEELSRFYENKKYVTGGTASVEKDVKLTKVNSTSFSINFGKFNISLFKNVDQSTNSNNWNIGTISKGANVIVPTGTDILGPVRINNNTDFIGGIHGDEITNSITIGANGYTYTESDFANISTIDCDTLTITMKSTCYDQIDGDEAFDRFIIIEISNNKIHVSNNFKALKNLSLKMATNGGLIACQNAIIKNITFNNSFYESAPEETVNNHSRKNTCVTFNTLYGSLTMINIKGYENENYDGYLHVYTNEVPMRNKAYFLTYKNGNYAISSGDEITGEFEYILA